MVFMCSAIGLNDCQPLSCPKRAGFGRLAHGKNTLHASSGSATGRDCRRVAQKAIALDSPATPARLRQFLLGHLDHHLPTAPLESGEMSQRRSVESTHAR